jgi:endonuclease G
MLSSQIAGDAAETDQGDTELRYHHYSVIMNAARRLAFVSAVNLNAEAPVQFDRSGSDRWVFDPRIAEELQAGNEFYVDNPLDRGHLTRRADAAWGRTEVEAKRGNDDTFHFTNCSPQHEVFNQSDRATKRGLLLWGNLENRVMDGAKEDALHVSVFNGPIFRSDDRTHRGLQVPRQFFKVIAARQGGQPRVFAFILSQATLIERLPEEAFTPEEAFSAGPFKPFQVPLSTVETRTGLRFAASMRAADVMRPGGAPGREEAARELPPRPLESSADLVLTPMPV